MVDDKPAGWHQTVTRVTRILEEVVYRPGSTYSELTRAIGAPKSSVYGFIRGLISADWLFEENHRLYMGPAFYSLAIASGHVRAGMITDADVDALYRETGLTVFIGIRAADHLIYIAEAGTNLMSNFEARTNLRRDLLTTAGGKAHLAAMPEAELETYLRSKEPEQHAEVIGFLEACTSIRETGIAVSVNNVRARTGIATLVWDSSRPVASVTLVGPTPQVLPRLEALSTLLLERVGAWQDRTVSARELI